MNRVRVSPEIGRRFSSPDGDLGYGSVIRGMGSLRGLFRPDHVAIDIRRRGSPFRELYAVPLSFTIAICKRSAIPFPTPEKSPIEV